MHGHFRNGTGITGQESLQANMGLQATLMTSTPF